VNENFAEDIGEDIYQQDTAVNIRAGKRDGYIFVGWTTDDGLIFADIISAITSFIMPDRTKCEVAQGGRKHHA